MALTSLQANLVVQWVLSVSNTPFADTTQGVDALEYTLEDLNEIFNEVYVGEQVIAASSTFTIDLTDFEDLTYQDVEFNALLFLFVLPEDGPVKVGPGASDGLDVFGSTNTVTIPENGCNFWGGDPAGTGLTVDGTHKTLSFANTTGSPITVNIVVAGAAVGPTVSSATITGSTSQILTVVFDEDVNIADATGITLTDSTASTTPALTYASGSGTDTLVFDLATNVSMGDTCTWAYDGTVGNIVSTAANIPLATFTGAAVTNSAT